MANSFFQRLRKNHLMRFIKFGIVGGSGTVVNLGVQYLLTLAGMHYIFAGVIATEISIINNFLLNNFWTWKDNPAKSKRSFVARLLKYNSSMIITGIAQNFLMIFFTELFKINDLISKFIAIVIITFVNYIIHYFWTFKGEIDETK
ncbi:MAG: GtrA family protein [Candidatus Cloacimonetes bacterium]|nr:GtrA family protein [Candidatus Cloacimonadota bacterium]